MTRKRKWVLRVSVVVVLGLGAAGTWAAMNLPDLKAAHTSRQLRAAGTDTEREVAADKLMALGDPGITRLLDMIRTGDEPCRTAAAGAFRRHLDSLPDGEPRTVVVAGKLLDVFPSCDAGGQRVVLELLPTAMKKAGNTQTAKCREVVAAGLKMADPAARVLAARLAFHPDMKLRTDLMPLLTAPEAEVRRAALFAATTAADGEHMIADEELFHFLHDTDDGVRKVSRDALVSRDRSETVISLGRRLVDPDPLERLKLLLDLRYDDDVADPEPWLERLSRDPEPAVRAGAARVAVEVAMSRKQNCPGWVGRVAETDESFTVRRIAAFFRKQSTTRVDPNVRPIDAP